MVAAIVFLGWLAVVWYGVGILSALALAVLVWADKRQSAEVIMAPELGANQSTTRV